jgi:predicted amidohydrolase
MNSQLTVALAQVTCGDTPEQNLETASTLAGQAADGGADLLVFPEMFMAQPTAENSPARLAVRDQGHFLEALSRIGADTGLFVAAGGWEASELIGRAYNTLHTVSPEGRMIGSYRKLHLFDALGMCESETMAPGADLPLVLDMNGITVGFAICYDLRFPELFRYLADQGAQLVIVSSAWYQGPMKEDHWLTLLRARAIENTFYVAGCNLVGPSFCGRSTLFDPFGTPVAGAGEEPSLIFGRVCAERVAAVRKKMPCLENRRRDLF